MNQVNPTTREQAEATLAEWGLRLITIHNWTLGTGELVPHHEVITDDRGIIQCEGRTWEEAMRKLLESRAA